MLATILALTILAASDERYTPPPRFAVIGEIPPDRQDELVAAMTKKLQDAKAALRAAGRARYSSGQAKREAIIQAGAEVTGAEQVLRAVKAGKMIALKMGPAELKVDAFGLLDFPVIVSQVIDATTVLCYAEAAGRGEPFFLRGIPTAPLTDGDELRVKKPVVVTGTESYVTVQGARKTVLVAEARQWPW